MKKILLLILLFPFALISQVTANDAFLYVCDDDNNGFSTFDLTMTEAEILAGQTINGYDLTYHETLVGAENGTNAIVNVMSYQNTSPYHQVIYARLESYQTGEFANSSIDLYVNLTPEANPYVGIVHCSTDGVSSTFDLTISETTILGSQNPVDFEIFYFETLADAEAFVNQIVTPQNFTNYMNPQTVYVRVENANTACWNITSFDIAVIGCEDDEDGDLVENQYEDVDNTSNEGRNSDFNSADGNLANDDTDGDGIPNYLDNDDDDDAVLTADEDYNNNGDPTDDDTNNNGIPDYLETEVTLAVNDFERANFSMFPNPATNFVKFRLDNALVIEEAKIYAIDGSLVKIFSEKQLSTNSVNISELMSGVYFIQFKSGKSTIAKKLIVR
ncbi:T9SS type A sorting domain-containing protein [Mesonia mobilis]|uniref:Secretion system C-terminal sorting domain-containing protein n=1 Tax=Mesonia mobilis TaxID=369791 RepID=A0ABQ3C1U5_9FLAO|nr:T9SS type A sorting domain-containing protein [Mesonia mobilis]MBQ0738532.1 T9SS type A sorting domain-containing protein [Aquimarina celericrescens]GGZ64700.1 hypothetical protein GCM10008088_27740 [Mesonia mobilis]